MKNSRCIHHSAAVVLHLIACLRAYSVVSGQVDTFQDGTTDNWGGAPPTVVSTGGPAGASDQYLDVSANGGDGPGSKLITYNRAQWIGNYTAAGVNLISMDLKDFASTSLSIRIAFKDAVGAGAAGYTSTTPFVLADDGAWHHAMFAVSASAMTAINSPAESFAALIGGSGLAEFRILDSASPSLNGDTIAADLGIDNILAQSAGPTITSATWNTASGNWEDGSNWLGGIQAYGSAQTATFPGPTGAAPASATVTLTSNELIGSLAFTAASRGTYTFISSAHSTLTFNGSGSGISLASTAGNVTINSPLVFNNAVTATTNGGTLLTIGGGITGIGGLNKAGAGTLVFAAPSAGSGLASLNLSSVAITGGTVALMTAAAHSDRSLLITSGISITGGALDLGGNDAIFHGASNAAIATLLQAGYHNGSWNGSAPSIISSLAGSDSSHHTALGSITGATSFDGLSVLTSDVLVKYTYYGDANLDGKVDGSDYARIDSGYLTHSTGWLNGDFNYDAIVNGSDYTLIDNAFNAQGAPLAADVAVNTSQVAAVPEPSTLGLLAIATRLCRRRRTLAKIS